MFWLIMLKTQPKLREGHKNSLILRPLLQTPIQSGCTSTLTTSHKVHFVHDPSKASKMLPFFIFIHFENCRSVLLNDFIYFHVTKRVPRGQLDGVAKLSAAQYPVVARR